MKQILPHFLWLGHARESGDFRQLFSTGIKAVVELAVEEPPSQLPRELIYCRFPLLDGAGNEARLLSLAIRTVGTLVERRLPTLVCCSSGLSRSPAVAAAALALVYQESPEQWLQRVAERHPSDVSPGLWNELTGLLRSVGS